MKEALTLLGDAVHQLQKERGYIALFLGGGGENFSAEMTEQFKATDNVVTIVNEAYRRWEKNQQIKSIDKLGFRLKKLAQLNEQRRNVGAFYRRPLRTIYKQPLRAANHQTPQAMYHQPIQSVQFYTYDIIAPLLEIMVEVALFDPQYQANHVSAYSNFLQWKERIGRTRAHGALWLDAHKQGAHQFGSSDGNANFCRRALEDPEFIDGLKALVMEQESYQKTFFALADSTQQARFNQVFDANELSDAEATIEAALHSTEATPACKQLAIITAAKWYALISRKINCMYQVEKQLIDTLSHNGPAVDNQLQNNSANNQTNKPEDTPASTVTKNHTSGISQQTISFLKSLPFFSNLQDSVFYQLIESAHVREYKKGKSLLLEREQATRFYIILQGWVKLYKGNVTGEETIVQMLSSGDAVIASAVFLNIPYPLSAQIAETASLLSFPAPMIRQLIRNDNALAVNMLTNLSQRSQLLIQQVEATRLKSTTERVGWFLLKTLLNQSESCKLAGNQTHKRVQNHVKLPYDKSMIASYLNMKPETFSRTLKRFKEQGFDIENDTIMLASGNALCEFCDTDIAQSCSRHKTVECPNTKNDKALIS